MFRELEDGVDRPRDEFFRIGLTGSGLLATDPVFQVTCFEVRFDSLTASLPGIIAHTRVNPCLPEFCGESGREGVRRRAKHVLVHPGQLLDGKEVTVGERR